MNTYAVIGLGRFGTRIARKLSEMGNEVLAVDIKNDPVQQIADDVTRAVVADGRDKEVLRTLGVRNCDYAIVAIGENLSASILTTMNLKELEVPYVLCKANDRMHKRVLEKIGADRIIIPESEVADRLAHTLGKPNILDYIELSDKYGIVEEEPPRSWVGKTIRELNVNQKYGINVLGIKNGDLLEVSQIGDRQILPDDSIVILGNYDAIAKLK